MSQILDPQVLDKAPATAESPSEVTSRATSLFSRVLVAIDRTEASEFVFQKALQLSQKHQSQLMIFTCLSDAVMGTADSHSSLVGVGLYGIDSTAAIAMAENQWKVLLKETQTWLRHHHEQARDVGVVAEFDHKRGEPGPTICEVARQWEADLIIVGRRGRQGLSEFLLGSVSNYVLHHAPCSVLVVQGH